MSALLITVKRVLADAKRRKGSLLPWRPVLDYYEVPAWCMEALNEEFNEALVAERVDRVLARRKAK
jgi:hypothetical protein